MKICLVSAELAPFIPGGAGTYAFEMARALRDAGTEVHLLTFPRPGLEREGLRGLDGVALHMVDLQRGAAAYPAYNCRALRHSMGVYEALRPLHERERFDAIEFPDFGGEGYFSMRARRAFGCFENAILAIRCHTPIAVCKTYQGDARLNRSDVIVEHMERFCLGEADFLSGPSRAVFEEIARHWESLHERIRRAPVFANPLGCMDEDMAHSESGQVEIVFSGRLEWLKGPDLLVRGVQSLLRERLECRCRLIGRDTTNSPAARSVRRLLRESIDTPLRDRFDFDRPMARNELLEVISSASVVVVPSRYENQSYAIGEAMQLGRCVVASDAGGTPELIEDGTSGLLFRSGDAEDLARVLRRAIDDPDLRATLGAGARARAAILLDPARAAHSWLEAMESAPRRSPTRVETGGGLVSILVPHYNGGAFIEQTIASAVAQTYAPTEIIVVDDGSDDEASLAALDRIERDGHARVVRSAHAGVSSARNRAIAEARGEFVLMLDADDIAEPTLVAKSVDALGRNPGSSYVSPLIADFEDEPGAPIGGWIPLGLDPDILAVMNVASAGTGAFIRREVLLEVGGYDEAIPAYEDWDLFCTLCERGHVGEVLPEFLIRYRQSSGSLMQSAGKPNHGALHAYLLAKHPELAQRASVSLRLLLSQAERARKSARGQR